MDAQRHTDQVVYTNMVKKIGIFAGTFDPVHDGHIAFAQEALALGLEKVMFLVEPRPRRKQGVRALEHRLAMIQLATAHNTHFGVIVLEQARFTPRETLPALQHRFAGYELALLFGDDVVSHMVDHLAAWPHIRELAASAGLIIGARAHEQATLVQKLTVLKNEHHLPFRYLFVEPLQVAVSSSKIRLALKHEQPAPGLAPAVAGYIVRHGLYVSDNDG